MWAGRTRKRLRPFILCFNRTAFLIQKSSLKSSAFRPNPFPRILSKSCRHAAVPNRFLAHFSTSRTNGPRLLSRVKVGTHSALGERSHTTAHTPKQGASLPRPQHGLELPAKFLLFHRAFIYIHFPVLCELPLSATDLSQTIFHRVFQLLSQTPHVRFHERKWVHTRLCSKDRTQRLTGRNRGRFGWGRYYYPRSVPHVHQHPRAGYQNGVLCRFWVLAGCAPEERRKPSGQRCAYACRCSEGVAAPLGCVIFFRFCRNYGLYILRTDMVVGPHSSVLYIDNHLVHKYKTCYLCVCGFFQQNQNAKIQKFNLVNL